MVHLNFSIVIFLIIFAIEVAIVFGYTFAGCLFLGAFLGSFLLVTNIGGFALLISISLLIVRTFIGLFTILAGLTLTGL